MTARAASRLAARACVLVLLLSLLLPGAAAQSVRVVDLAVTKTDSPDPVLVGETITYTITVRNAGPDNARSVGLNDTLPAGTTFVSASPECTHAGAFVTCVIGGLNAGANATVTIVVRAHTAGEVTNQVRVTMNANDFDANLLNNVAVATTTVAPLTADLGVAKVASSASVKPGDAIVYSLVVTNAGPHNATNVTLTDTLPAGVTATAIPSGCEQTGNVVTCELGNLSVGGEVRLEIRARADTVGEKENVAVVNGSEHDPALANNTARASTTVLPLEADLLVVKVGGPSQVYVGDDITYEVNVTNGGPDTATGVTLVDTLPAGATFVSASASCTHGGGVVTCELGSIAPDASAEVAIVVRAEAAGVLVNSASASGDQQDPYLPNNVDTAETLVLARAAGLSLEKVGAPSTLVVGEHVTFDLRVANAGPTSARNVTINDTLPAGLSFVSASASCSAVGQQVTCQLGTLAVGANRTVSIVALAEAAGAHVNTATVTADEPDAFPADNMASETTLVVTAAPSDLACVAREDRSILLTWTPVDEAVSYNVYRETNGTFLPVGATAEASFADVATQPGASYTYRVTAVSAGGESAPSDTCSVTAIPYFPTLALAALGVLGAVGAYAAMRRRA